MASEKRIVFWLRSEENGSLLLVFFGVAYLSEVGLVGLLGLGGLLGLECLAV